MTNKQIINYIEQARGRGLKDEQIKEDLAKAGWQKELIGQHFVLISLPKLPRMRLPFLFFCLFLVLLFSGNASISYGPHTFISSTLLLIGWLISFFVIFIIIIYIRMIFGEAQKFRKVPLVKIAAITVFVYAVVVLIYSILVPFDPWK
jgi:hypothetical protein